MEHEMQTIELSLSHSEDCALAKFEAGECAPRYGDWIHPQRDEVNDVLAHFERQGRERDSIPWCRVLELGFKREFVRRAWVNTFVAEAEWREQKADEYPEDFRNGASARALRELAQFVESLSVDDPRFDQSEKHHVGFDDFVSLGKVCGYHVSRYGFDPRFELDPDDFFGWMIDQLDAEDQLNAEREAF